MALSRCDVAFVFPPAPGQAGAFGGHLGVGYLRAALLQSGITSLQYLNPHPGTSNEVARDLVALGPAIVGFTAYDANVPGCLAIAQSLKQQRPDTKVVLGGPAATFGAPELLRRHRAIDACLVGEAEETAPGVLGRLLDGAAPGDDQPGVAFRRDGAIVCTPPGPLVGGHAASAASALDVTPSPYLGGMLQDGRTGVLTGRGCTHHCQYCCFAALGRRTVRLHSVERVVGELEWVAEHQRRTGERYAVSIHDDTFTLLPARARALCRSIIDRGLNLALSCTTRADAVDDDLLELMRAAGFASVAFGLESAVPSVLRAAGKVRPPDWPHSDLGPERHFIERVRQGVVSAKKLGFHVGVSIILGLPTETAADGEATLRFVRSLPIDYYAHNVMCLFRGTPWWDAQARHGLACSIDALGVPGATRHAYDVHALRPRPKCVLERKAALVRGLAAEALSDCAAPTGSVGSVGTVVIRNGELTAETAEWLREVLAVGGIVVQLYPPSGPGARDRQRAQDLRVMSEHLVPAAHYVQAERGRRHGAAVEYVLGGGSLEVYRRHRPSRVSIVSFNGPSPLRAWLRGAPTAADVCEASPAVVRSPALARLARGIAAEPAASPLQQMPLPPRPRYAGRWLKEASCASLNRLEVDAKGNVRCCAPGRPLGRVGDSKEQLVARLSAIARATERRRGCDRCGAAACPRCPFPGVDDSTYCTTVKRNAPGIPALAAIRLYSRLPTIVARQLDRTAGE